MPPQPICCIATKVENLLIYDAVFYLEPKWPSKYENRSTVTPARLAPRTTDGLDRRARLAPGVLRGVQDETDWLPDLRALRWSGLIYATKPVAAENEAGERSIAVLSLFDLIQRSMFTQLNVDWRKGRDHPQLMFRPKVKQIGFTEAPVDQTLDWPPSGPGPSL
jgi:hypothetical protein